MNVMRWGTRSWYPSKGFCVVLSLLLSCGTSYAEQIDFAATLDLDRSTIVEDHLSLLKRPEKNDTNAWICFAQFPRTARVRCTDVIKDFDGETYAFFEFGFRSGAIKYDFLPRRRPSLNDCAFTRGEINRILAAKGPLCLSIEIPGSTVEQSADGRLSTITTKLMAVKSKSLYWEGYP